MKRQKEFRKYRISQADLKQAADFLLHKMQRDAADFATRGITPAHLLAFETLIEDFDNYPTDSELFGVAMDATRLKYIAVEDLKTAIRRIANMAFNAFNGEGRYTVFHFERMKNQTHDELYRFGKSVNRVATIYHTDLIAEGLTQAMIDEVKNLALALDAVIDAQHIAQENRTMSFYLRTEKANALWKKISHFSSIGKSLFAYNDEARYNDYVLG